MLIVLEGPDACGKATQSKRLQESLGGPARCSIFSFPRYETTLGKAILRHLKREIALCELQKEGGVAQTDEDAMVFQCMMTIDKYDGARAIERRLQSGEHVICDRWHQSAEIYGASDGIDPRWLNDIHAFLPKYHKTLNVYLELSEEEALRRRPVLRDRYEKDRAKQIDLRARYRAMWTEKAKTDPLSWVIVDAEQTMADVTSDICSAIAKMM